MITSVTNARVKQVVSWQNKARERRRDRVFLAEGARMCEEAEVSWIREVYLTRDMEERARENKVLWEKLQQSGYELVSDEVFAKMSDTCSPQGILSVLRQPEYDLEQLLKIRNPLFIVTENLQDPGNLGTILRTGEGAGITGVIMDGNTVDIFNPKTIRSTMGAIFRVPFVYTEHLGETVSRLHEAGVHTYAAHLQGKKYYQTMSFAGPTAFLIGNEGNGLTEETAALAEEYIKIPMEGKTESLNASVAAALLMYEAHRQRHAAP